MEGVFILNDNTKNTGVAIIHPDTVKPDFVEATSRDQKISDFLGYDDIAYSFMLPPFDGYILVYNKNNGDKKLSNYNFFYFTDPFYGDIGIIKVGKDEKEKEGVYVLELDSHDKKFITEHIKDLKEDPINFKIKEAINLVGIKNATVIIQKEVNSIIEKSTGKKANESLLDLSDENLDNLSKDIHNKMDIRLEKGNEHEKEESEKENNDKKD